MLQKIKNILKFSAKNGLYFPSAYDNAVDGPSITLLLVHLSSYIAMTAIGILLYKDTLAGTIAAMSYSVLMLVFYMLRKLTNAKFDLDDKSFELSNNELPESKL